MTTARAMTAVDYYKAAVAQGLCTKEDARRCLGAIQRAGRDVDPAKVAVHLGVLTREQALQVRSGSSFDAAPLASSASGSGSTPGAAAPAPARRPATKKTPRTRPAAPPAATGARPVTLMLVGVALLAGSLVGVAAVVATHGPSDQVSVVPALVAPAAVAPAAPVAAATKPVDDGLTETLRTAGQLSDLGKERLALEVLDEYSTRHGAKRELVRARDRLNGRCERLLGQELARLRAAALDRAGQATALSRLRERLPESFGPRVDALALELQPSPSTPEPSAEPQAEEEPATEETETDDLPPMLTASAEPAPRGSAPAASVEKPTTRPSTPREEPTPTTEAPADEPAAEPAPAAEDRTSPVAMALNELLHVRYALHDGKVDASYDFAVQGEQNDFETVGFDKAEINDIDSYGRVSGVDLELGVGSQRVARLQHVLALAGDFQIDLTLWLNHSSGRSNLTFLIGNKVGVRWGQQLVKVGKSGGMKPLSGAEPDRSIFREERDVTVRITRVGELLTVECNGRKVAQKTFKPGELDGHFGLIANDLRMIVTSLRIQGVVDASKL